jgi:acyl-CoA reductase-like NAD-dependent aldehyde dehydrogenase
MMADPRVRKVAFTGSPRVGKLLMDQASKTVTRLSLELGGNAPVIVCGDVGVEQAVTNAVTWKTRNCGQVCVAPQRFYVHEGIYKAFAERAAELMGKLKLGHGLDPSTQVGPLINARQRERVEEIVARSVAAGAKLEAGGERPAGKGYFYTPTVLSEVTPEMPVHTEEVFGPVMPLIPFRDEGEVLELANRSEYGLAGFVLTNDLNTSLHLSEGLEVGMVCVNDWLPATPEAPFGGVKGSGFGRETGSEGLLEYMETKTVFTGGVG